MSIILDGTNGITTPDVESSGPVSGTNFSYTGTLTGGTGVVNLGSGQVYKDASGNVGIGTSSPAHRLSVKQSGNTSVASFGLTVSNSANDTFLGLGYDATSDTFRVNATYSSTGAYKPISFWTADAERMRIDSAGNVGIGTSSVFDGNTRLELSKGGNCQQFISCTDGARLYFSASGNTVGAMGTFSNHPLVFRTNDTERARILSSSEPTLLVGTTSDPGLGSAGVQIRNGSSVAGRIDLGKTFSGNVTGMSFYHAGTQVGTITYSNTATAYNTSSDYRLKHDINPMTGALAKVQALKPVTYKWNADDSAGEGFIAHELAEVCPSAVTGEKDAVDAEGKPVYQGIDTSFLVATLTAAIQELKAINDAQAQTIESLTARVVALEGQA